MKNITTTGRSILYVFLLITSIAYAQAPTISSFSPSVVTQRTTVIITGNHFNGTTAANVKFGGISATSITVNSATQITAIVGNGATGSVTVTNNGSTATMAGLTYITPAATTAAARITRVISNFNGYWNSASPSTNPALQPDTSHSMLAFEYGGIIYSTGSATATSTLNANNVAFTAGNYRALPVNNLTGVVPSGSGNPNLIALASKIDGNPNTQVPTAPAVAGLSVRDVLIDGIRGLDLGTGVTNLPSTSVLLFNASNILSAGINDNVPDILVSQIADPSDNSYSIYSFVDANGNIVGNPIQIALNSVPAVGRYKSDFFTLPAGQPLNTATVNGSTIVGANTRDIRLVGYKLSDFGINDANKDNAVYFKVMPSGTSDPAFMAYNRDSFQIPSPIITSQPSSVVACTGAGNSVTFTVAATGEELTYQWEKNGMEIPGATSASYTITNVQASDVAGYRVLITNSAGAALSNYAYLNTMISVQPISTPACQNTPVQLQTIANGLNISYQWYSNTTNSSTGGTMISGATSGTYSPPVDTVGTMYYYAIISNNGQACATATTNAAAVAVSLQPVAGTATGNTTICPDNNAQVSLTGYTGNIQWQQSTNGVNGWVNVMAGSGGTTATYTTPALPATMYYRAVLSSGSCPDVISNTVTVTVQDTFVWNGSINNNWHEAANWSCNAIPTLVNDVMIPVTANQPVVLSGQMALGKSLAIQADAVLTINANNNIKIMNTINVAPTGNMIINSSANLLQNDMATTNTNSGNITVLRKSSPLYRLDYTLWSTPVAGQNIFKFSPQTIAGRFYTYNTATDLYNTVPNLSDTSTSTFNTGTAYLIRMPNSNATAGYNAGTTAITYTGEFKGVPNSGTINIPVSLAGERYNGTGNPYPSALNIWDFIDTNVNNLETGTLYFWRKKNNNSNSSYASITKFAYTSNMAEGGDTGSAAFVAGQEGNWSVNAGQGFIVKASATAANITFTNAMRRATNNTQFFRFDNEFASSKFRINMLSQDGGFSQAVIGYSNMTTDGLDFGWDGVMLDDAEMAVYTVVDGTNLSIQANGGFSDTDVVPLSYKTAQAGSYTFEMQNTDGIFAEGQEVFLKDNLAHTVHNIKDANYQFVTEAGTFDNRFEIIYTNQALGIKDGMQNNSSIIIYKNDGKLEINAFDATLATAEVYDTRGRLLTNLKDINATQATIQNLQAEEQVLIVKATTAEGITVSKKIVY